MLNKLGEIENYFQSPHLSQSFLKLFLRDQPRSLQRVKEQKYYYDEKKHFIQGSLIDFICTMPSTTIDELYYVERPNIKPIPGIMSIINEIVDNNLEFTNEIIIEFARKQEYQNRQKDATLIENITKHQDYHDSLVEAKGKQIITQEELETATICAAALLNGEYTSHYFNNKNIEYQKAIYKRNLKGLLDLCYVNHEVKEARVIDIKSTGDYLESFNVFKWRYDFQLSFYSELLQMEHPSYKILPPVILAVSKKEPEFAEPFEFTEETLRIGREGGEVNGQKVLGWEQCLDNYIYWEKHQNLYSQQLMQNKVNYV